MRKRIVFQPETHEALLRGIEQIVAAVRPTLGPRPHLVAVESARGRHTVPELLDNAATVARRIIAIADPDADMGAMLVRHLLWRQTERYGDGAATAAVLFQAIVAGGLRYIASGGNAMLLRRYLENGMHLLLKRMSQLARPIRGEAALARLAQGICHDRALAEVMGEIFDIVGEYGYLEVRPGQGRGLEREYVEGLYWDGGLHARSMLPEGTPRIEIENAALLLTDLDIEAPQEIVPALEAALQGGRKGLVVTARTVSESVRALLMINSQPDRFQAIAVKAPAVDIALQAETLLDLGIVTGGRVFARDAGASLAALRPQDLGSARRAWANMDYFGIVGGQGDPRLLRQHLAELRRGFHQVRDREQRERLQKRIGKLMGGAAILHVGGLHEMEVNARKELAERTAAVLRDALREGIVPGGGAAFLACQEVCSQQLTRDSGPDERAAYQILYRALEAPLRTIVSNAGYDAGRVLAELRSAGPGEGFDVETGTVTDMFTAGLCDSAAVQRAALANAISTAALALTVDVLVHHKHPEPAYQT